MKARERYINAERVKFVRIAKKMISDHARFAGKIAVVDNETGEVTRPKFGEDAFLSKKRDDYLNFLFRSMMLQRKAVAEKMTAVFVTITLPTEYHPFTVRGDANKTFKPELDGYRKLRDFHRSVYHDFMKRKGNRSLRIEVLQVSVVEYHKSFVPHMHAVYFVPTDRLSDFETHFMRQLVTHGMGMQYDYEVLKDVSRGVAYVMKYVRKSSASNDLETALVMAGWKREHGIKRQYSFSNIGVPRQVSQQILRTLRPKVEQGQNVLEEIERLCDIEVSYVERDTEEYNIKRYGTKKGRYGVTAVIERYRYKSDSIDIIELLAHNPYRYSRGLLQSGKIDLAELHDYAQDFLPSTVGEVAWIDRERFDYIGYFLQFDYRDLVDLVQNFAIALRDKKTRYRMLDITMYDRIDQKFVLERSKKTVITMFN